MYGKTLNQIAGSDISITSMGKWVFYDITAVTRSAETLTDASFCLCSVICFCGIKSWLLGISFGDLDLYKRSDNESAP